MSAASDPRALAEVRTQIKASDARRAQDEATKARLLRAIDSALDYHANLDEQIDSSVAGVRATLLAALAAEGFPTV